MVKKETKNDIHEQVFSCPKQTNYFLQLAEDLCGIVKGPKDLSFNKKHLDGFGK